MTATFDGKEIAWTEKWLFVRSFMQAKAAQTALQERLSKAKAALDAWN